MADTGEGIPSEHLPHLFERVYRVDPARSRAAGGAGLGLAICEWVSRAHGGRLEVASALGRGSTFSVWLPVAPSSAAPEVPGMVGSPGARPAPVA